MRYLILCPECGNSNIQMKRNSIGHFTCNACETEFTIFGAYNDETSQNKTEGMTMVSNLFDWIPTSNGFFPDDNTTVQVTYIGYNDHLPYCNEFAYRSGNEWYWDSDDVKAGNVEITAWRYNCTPYQEETKSKELKTARDSKQKDVLKKIDDIKVIPRDEQDAISIAWNDALERAKEIIQTNQSTIHLKAKYIGENYKGFKTGRIYDIATWCAVVTGHGLTAATPCLCVRDIYSTTWCPYSRLETFLKNWTLL